MDTQAGPQGRDGQAATTLGDSPEARMRDALAYYADTFCELGVADEGCGKLSDDDCSGCRARALLASATPAPPHACPGAEGAGWRPIGTAPRGGRKVLLGHRAYADPFLGLWSRWNGWWTTGESDRSGDHVRIEPQPTHWMPAPALPR